MTYETIIPAAELALHLDDPDWVIVDSRFKLADPAQGKIDYETAHIPGAVYAHLDEDLSGPIIKGVTGRHPLPSVEQAARVFSRLGIDAGIQVVAYDDISGALAAGRVWWLLRWLGHDAVAILDGGWQAWVNQGYAVRGGTESRSTCGFSPQPRNDMIVSAEDVDKMRQDPEYRVLDARAADRYRGENETIDPIPGHIPGAVSAAYAGNLNPDGTFMEKDKLKARYERLIGDVPTQRVVCYCGSGVTATHDILAMVMAGMGEAKLYAGSYSEWIADPQRPVEK
jgi:thiosulfate/3-mercaptopyruvate sulfurtransferase